MIRSIVCILSTVFLSGCLFSAQDKLTSKSWAINSGTLTFNGRPIEWDPNKTIGCKRCKIIQSENLHPLGKELKSKLYIHKRLVAQKGITANDIISVTDNHDTMNLVFLGLTSSESLIADLHGVKLTIPIGKAINFSYRQKKYSLYISKFKKKVPTNSEVDISKISYLILIT